MSKVLVIDDNRMIRTILRRALEKFDYTVDEATNGEEAIQSYNENPADLIITDIFMPIKGGLETIKELKLADPDIKIIAISGNVQVDSSPYPGDDILVTAKKMGAQATFQKPFELDEVLSTVKKMLS